MSLNLHTPQCDTKEEGILWVGYPTATPKQLAWLVSTCMSSVVSGQHNDDCTGGGGVSDSDASPPPPPK